MKPRPGQRVLSIGVNDARELELFEEVGARQLELWGVDWNHSAIAAARARFPAHAHRMLEHDLSEISAIDFPKFDIVLALNTLHCTSVDRDRVLQSLTMNTTAETQWLISIPNCHFGTRDILRRPIDRSDPRHDRSRALKDLRYLTRYFYRAGYQNVTTFGTYDWMLLVRA